MGTRVRLPSGRAAKVRATEAVRKRMPRVWAKGVWRGFTFVCLAPTASYFSSAEPLQPEGTKELRREGSPLLCSRARVRELAPSSNDGERRRSRISGPRAWATRALRRAGWMHVRVVPFGQDLQEYRAAVEQGEVLPLTMFGPQGENARRHGGGRCGRATRALVVPCSIARRLMGSAAISLWTTYRGTVSGKDSKVADRHPGLYPRGGGSGAVLLPRHGTGLGEPLVEQWDRPRAAKVGLLAPDETRQSKSGAGTISCTSCS